MKTFFSLSRRDFQRLLPAAPAAFRALFSAPRKVRRKTSSRRKGPPRIPEKPFREEDLWTPHDYAG